MKCPACGAENTEGAQRCTSCRLILDSPSAVTVRVSRVALASAILSLSIVVCAIPVIMAACDPRMLRTCRGLVMAGYILSVLIGSVGFLLGVVGWILIASSGGRVTGQGFATVGMLVPVGAMLAVLALDCVRRSGPNYRLRCGTNLAVMGKVMLIYANDYDDKLPVAGGRGTAWGLGPVDWAADSRVDAFGLDPNGAGGEASICSSLYLLIRYAEMTPKGFVCPEERKVTEFDPGKYEIGGKKLTDVWDFGPAPALHCSYAYHAPYSRYPLTTANRPSLAVAADRNPWIRSPAHEPGDFIGFKPDVPPSGGTPEEARNGNSKAHWGDGQNVLFLDGHVDFIKRPYQDPSSYAFPVPDEKDNIYTSWDGDDKTRGIPPQPYDAQPADRRDVLLLNDPPRR